VTKLTGDCRTELCKATRCRHPTIGRVPTDIVVAEAHQFAAVHRTPIRSRTPERGTVAGIEAGMHEQMGARELFARPADSCRDHVRAIDFCGIPKFLRRVTVAITAQQRRAPAVIDKAGLRGAAEAALLAHGFEHELLIDLVRTGLASARTEMSRVGGQAVEVARIVITAEGRRELSNEAKR
jgi:hypothetical protein